MKNCLKLFSSMIISGVREPFCASLILVEVLLWYDPSSLSDFDMSVVRLRMSVYILSPSGSNYLLAIIFIYLINSLVDWEKNVLRQLIDLTALNTKLMSRILGMNSSMRDLIFKVKLSISWNLPLFLLSSMNTLWISLILASSSNNMSSFG